MAICLDCERDMLTASSCTVSELHIEGVAMPLERFGQDGNAGSRPQARCGDCGVALEGFHHLGCDLARCPRCRRQLLSCGCPFDEFGGQRDDDDGYDDDGYDDDGYDDEDEDHDDEDEDHDDEDYACPSCGSAQVIPILYGSPNPVLASPPYPE